MTRTRKECLEAIDKELQELEEGKKYGNVEFIIHLQDGNPMSMSVKLNKTVKFVKIR